MGIGREVADAYISVHGDLSPFRKELNKANGEMEAWAIENADSFSDAWGQRMASGITRQWGSVIDALHSGDQVNINKMIGSFDSSDLDSASEKIHALLNDMRTAGKFTDEQYAKTVKTIDDSTKALQRQAFIESDLAKDREAWGKAHKIMMAQLADAREKAAKQEASIWDEALAANKAYDARRRKTMEAAIKDNERWGRSFEGITKNANLAALESDFRSVTEAMRTADFSKFAKGFGTFEDLRRRVTEVTAAMHEQGRMSDDVAQRAIDNANAYIGSEEDKARATREALDAAREAREEQERFNKSFEGMVKAAKELDLEQRFRGISNAMTTMDFSVLARGSRNMDELRTKTLQTAHEMRNLGRMTDEEFRTLGNTITAVGEDMDAYNVRFREANAASTRHRRDWTVIQAMIGNAGKKFAGFSGLNVMSDVFHTGAAFFQDLDRNAVKIGKMTVLIGAAAASVLHAVGGLAAMGQDLAALGSISILGPAFLTGAGIAIGVMVAAFKDMKTVLADLGPKFGKLQDQISAKFWAQAEEPIRRLTNQLLPTLSKQLSVTATMTGAIFAELANSISKYASENEMAVMFERLNAALDRGKAAVDPLVKAFALLGEVGSRYFGRAADAIVGMAEHFERFISAAHADGRLVEWTERAIQAFKDVGSVMSSAVGIWNAIGDAAGKAGIGGLGAFADALERGAAVMQSPAFQSSLTILFIGAAAAARTVGDAIVALGPAMESVMPTLSVAMMSIGATMATVIGYFGQLLSNPAVQQGITDFTNGINTAITNLGPAIAPMGDSLGQVLGLMGQVAGQVGTIIAAMAVGLSPVLDQVTAAFARITFAAGPEIVAIIGILSPMLQQMVDILLPPLENLIMTVLPLLTAAFAALAPIFPVIAAAIAPIIDAITQLVNMIAPFLIPAIQQIVTAITPVIEVFGQVVGFILSVLVPILGVLLIGVINNVVGVFQGLSNFIMGFVAIVTAIFTGFGAFFTKLFAGDIGGALTALGTMFGQIWDGIIQMLSGALEFLWNAVQLIFIGKLIGGIKTGLTTIANFFKSSWDNIGGTVSGALGNIVGFINSGLSNARSFVQSALSAMVNFFRSGWDDMVSAVGSGVGNVMSWVSGLPGRIGGALSGLGGLLVNAGSAIINGLLNGLKSAWGAVTSFVGGIADWIANNKGPLPYDRQLLVPAGKAIMDGLGNGLMSKLAMLKGVLDTVTDTMTDSVTEAFAHSKMYLAGADAALGLADGLKSEKNAVANALGAVIPVAGSSSLKLSAPGQGGGAGGVGGPTPAQRVVNIEKGAVQVVTPTKDPELVASSVIDRLVINSNL